MCNTYLCLIIDDVDKAVDKAIDKTRKETDLLNFIALIIQFSNLMAFLIACTWQRT